MDDVTAQSQEKFNFAWHEADAITSYLQIRGFYADLALATKRIAEEALKRRTVQIHSIEARAKDPVSFGKKASKPSKNDPDRPMYPRPLEQITDLSAIRIITFFPRTIDEIGAMLKQEFAVIEQLDKGESLIEEEKFGYKGVHYVVSLNSSRESLPEYERFREAKTEIQVRTILQHAWAEIEHDIQYKSSATIPRDIKRRFMSLAGLLEIADREFQAIQDADRDLNLKAKSLITEGKLDDVELTPDALKEYLDKSLGPDGRMSDFSYDWVARLLQKLGFRSLEQVDHCVKNYDGANLSRVLSGSRQGQIARFEYMLLAGMGETFITRHPWVSESWFPDIWKKKLEKLEKNGIGIGKYDPILNFSQNDHPDAQGVKKSP